MISEPCILCMKPCMSYDELETHINTKHTISCTSEKVVKYLEAMKIKLDFIIEKDLQKKSDIIQESENINISKPMQVFR